MPKLHQILALEQGVKTKKEKVLTAAYHLFQKGSVGPFTGITRTYAPRDDDGEHLPGESNRVQIHAEDELSRAMDAVGELIDLTAGKDLANCTAKADIVVDGVTLAHDVPVTTLLFLDKILDEIRALASSMPVLDPSFNWEFDNISDAWRSEEKVTTRQKKVPRSHVLYDATPEHPAQVQAYNEDVVVGDWTTIHFSGAVPASHVSGMLARVEALKKAVKVARETANETAAEAAQMGDVLLDFIVGSPAEPTQA